MGTKVRQTGIAKLSALEVQRLKTPGHHGDGGGLWLQISASGAKSWVFRFTRAAKTREMGLGPLHTISLAEARGKAHECRQQLLNGHDPIQRRDGLRLRAAAAAIKGMQFKTAAAAYIESHRAGWKNAKHAAQWEATLEEYAHPVIGELDVADVDTGLVMRVLLPIWTTKTETASRVRGRVEAVLDWCKVQGQRSGDNPARWRGHLDKLLPKRSKVTKVRNHPALPYAEIGAFMKKVRDENGMAAKALQFIILTATRTSEAIEAEAAEVDAAGKVWSIPAGRMKAEREHRVPLSAPALAVLREAKAMGPEDSPYLFAGAKPGKPLSNMACLELLRRMGYGHITVHGFRSTFRDWAAEQTAFPGDVAEAALSHAVKDATEAAYRRGDLFEKRVKLMTAWAAYCSKVAPASGQVVPIKAA